MATVACKHGDRKVNSDAEVPGDRSAAERPTGTWPMEFASATPRCYSTGRSSNRGPHPFNNLSTLSWLPVVPATG